MEKHRPQSAEQLAVAKRKVQEARDWLAPFQDAAVHPAYPRILLLTGELRMFRHTARGSFWYSQSFNQLLADEECELQLPSCRGCLQRMCRSAETPQT